MRFVGNIVNLLTGGIILALGWFLAGLLYCIPRVTRPLAAPCFELARLCLWPAGHEAVRDRHVERYRSFILTGQTAGPARPAEAPLRVRAIQLALWLPAAIPLMLGHLVHGLLQALAVLGNPWETRNFSLLGPAAFPLGVRVAKPSQARTMRLIGVSRRGPRYPAPIRQDHPIGLACRRIARPSATIGAACLILWASSSNNEAHLHPQAGPIDLRPQLSADGVGNPFGRAAVEALSDARVSPFTAEIARPRASPPLRIAPSVPAAPSPQSTAPCTVAAEEAVASPHLSRKQLDYGAQPLGSRPIRAGLPSGHSVPLRHALNVQRWVGSVKHGKAPSLLCRAALAAKIARSTELAAKTAAAERLARKAPPGPTRVTAGGRLTYIGPQAGHAAELRHVAKLHRWSLSATYAKADAVLAPEVLAERIGRSTSLHAPAVVDYQAASKAARNAVLPRAGKEQVYSPAPERMQRVADLTAKLSAR